MENDWRACLRVVVNERRVRMSCVVCGAVATCSLGYSKGNINIIGRL